MQEVEIFPAELPLVLIDDNARRFEQAQAFVVELAEVEACAGHQIFRNRDNDKVYGFFFPRVYVCDSHDVAWRAPKGLLDLKAAVRYLRFFDRDMLGDAEHIITDGTSAGGAMSSLLGSTGNNPSYEPMLKAMGAADTRDDKNFHVYYIYNV